MCRPHSIRFWIQFLKILCIFIVLFLQSLIVILCTSQQLPHFAFRFIFNSTIICHSALHSQCFVDVYIQFCIVNLIQLPTRKVHRVFQTSQSSSHIKYDLVRSSSVPGIKTTHLLALIVWWLSFHSIYEFRHYNTEIFGYHIYRYGQYNTFVY